MIEGFIGFVLHIDTYLSAILQEYGLWTYLFLFLIIFLETGIILTPFLPGGSLLFAAGAFAARGALDSNLLISLLGTGAVLGSTMNYWIGYHTGTMLFKMNNAHLISREYLARTHQFYEKYGGKTVVMARFFPIIRTFSPMVAGMGRMRYWTFLAYDIAGGFAWVFLFVSGGFYLGNMPFIKENFSLVILGIIALSLLPVLKGLKHSHHKPS